MTIAFRPLRNPNPMGFPSGVQPGFDPTHLAAANTTFSAIGGTGTGNFVSILNGSLGTITSGSAPKLPTQTVDNLLGPASNFGGISNSTSYIQFPGSATKPRQLTFAGMVSLGNESGLTVVMFSNCGGSGAAGSSFGYVAATGPGLRFPGVVGSVPSSLRGTQGHRYFMGVSCDTTQFIANFVLVDIGNGVTLSQVVSHAAIVPGTSDANYLVANFPNGAAPSNEWAGNIAALMYSTSYLTMAQLLSWAADPWAFWYPRGNANMVGVAASGFQPYWANQNNMPVIGTGTY